MMALSQEQIETFWRDGFIVVPNLLTPEEVQALRVRTEQIILGQAPFPSEYIQIEPAIAEGKEEEPNPLYRVRKMWELTRYDPVFHEYAKHPRIVEIIIDLLGPDIKLFGDQMMLKPPFHGSMKPYHQDSAYWPIEPMELVTCWLAMDDSTRENGCMRFLPGTHKLGLLKHTFLEYTHEVPEGWEEMSRRPDQVYVELKAGGCSFHHSLVLHETSPNRSPYPRRGMTTAYMRATSRYADKAPKPEFIQIAGKSYPGCV